MDLERVAPDPERAASLAAMAMLRLESISLLRVDLPKFASKIAEEFYDALLELVTARMAKDGWKVRTDQLGSHRATLAYLQRFPEFHEADMPLQRICGRSV